MMFRNMAAAHNVLIQGINAVVAHAPHITEEKVQPFMVFCSTLVRAHESSQFLNPF